MWLYVPSTDSPYVPGPEGSNLDLASCSPDIELYATSSGKSSPRPLSWPGWKTRPYIKRLSGTISRPSMAERGVESWISSLRDSLVSRSVQRASNRGPTTSDGSGRSSSDVFATFNPDGSLSRTCLDLFDTDSDPSSVDWPSSGMMINGVCSAQPPLERRISANVSGASPADGTAWTTPAADDTGARSEKYAQGGTPLSMQAGMWAENWPTPRAEDSESAGNHPGAVDSLTGAVKLWATPGVHTSPDASPNSSRMSDLREQAKLWGTPTAHERTHTARDVHHGEQLANQAETWPTPRAIDANGAAQTAENPTPGQTGGTSLPGACRSSHPALQSSTCGPECSPGHRRLSPPFVEYLMGWPIGWTTHETSGFSDASGAHYAPTDSALAETEYTRWLRLSRSWLSQIAPAGWRI